MKVNAKFCTAIPDGSINTDLNTNIDGKTVSCTATAVGASAVITCNYIKSVPNAVKNVYFSCYIIST